MLFAFGILQTKGATEYPSGCDPTGGSCVVYVVCPDLQRPFSLHFPNGEDTVTVGCGWPQSNTAFRSVVAWAALLACVFMQVGVSYDNRNLLVIATWVTFGAAVSMVSVMTLDGNSVRVGQDWCGSLAPGIASCVATTFVGLVCGDALVVLLLYVTHLLGKRYVTLATGCVSDGWRGHRAQPHNLLVVVKKPCSVTLINAPQNVQRYGEQLWREWIQVRDKATAHRLGCLINNTLT